MKLRTENLLANLTDAEVESWIEGLTQQEKSELLKRMLKNTNTRNALLDLTKQQQVDDTKRLRRTLDSNARAIIPNPWIGLPLPEFYDPNGQYFRVDNPQFTAPFKLRSLPLELILEIADLLPPESAATLALVGKHFMHLLRKCFRKLQAYSQPRWSFLQLLERDSSELVACPSCETLHPPFASTSGGGVGAPRCDIQAHHDNTSYAPSFGTRIPASLNYNTVRAIARQHARGPQGAAARDELLSNLSETKTLFCPDARAIRTTSCRIVQGSLVMRSQIVIAPDLPTPETNLRGASLGFIYYCLNLPQFRICRHTAWRHGDPNRDRELTFTVLAFTEDACHLQARYGEDRIPRSELRDEMGEELGDLLFSQPPCYTFGCTLCPTDFAAGFADIDGLGRVLTLTTWKDLGGVSDEIPGNELSWRWDAHRRNINDRSEVDPLMLTRRLSGNLNGGTRSRRTFELGGPERDNRSSDYHPIVEDFAIEMLKEGAVVWDGDLGKAREFFGKPPGGLVLAVDDLSHSR